jgi:hypothetical protein
MTSSIFAPGGRAEGNQLGTSTSWLTSKNYQGRPPNVPITQGDQNQFYRSISSNLGSNFVKQQSSFKEPDNMCKTFSESNSLPPQKRVFKIKAFKPIPSGQALESNLTLGETLKQNREIKEKIEKERADIAQIKMMQTPEPP